MSPVLEILSCILTLYLFRLGPTATASGFFNLPSNRPDENPRPRLNLTNPLIGDRQKIYICSENTLLVFRNNGSISRRIPLNYTCNQDITPVHGPSRRVYLVAENRILKVDTRKIENPKSAAEVFLGPETNVHNMKEIIGLSVSIINACVLVTISQTGLFSYNYDGKLRWSTAPAITRLLHRPDNRRHSDEHLGFRQGCRKNFSGCYFISPPVIDHCESNIYMLNNQQEVYAVSFRSPQFKWIQDVSGLGKTFTITSGNNGKLYLIEPDRSLIFGLDVRNGTVLWQQNIGPVSRPDIVPAVDANGWISIGSLDGFLYSISPTGRLKKFPKEDATVRNIVIGVNPVLDCSGYAVYISQDYMEGKESMIVDGYNYISAKPIVFFSVKLLVPATGSVYWSENYPGNLAGLFWASDLRNFHVDESVLLAFISISDTQNPLPCLSTRKKLESSCSLMDTKPLTFYTGNERAITIFLFFETLLLILLTGMVRFCCTFWKKRKIQNQDLGNFLEKRKSLLIQKKVFDRTITELEKKPTTTELVEQIGELVREKERIERKLSSTYSFGEDAETLESKSLIPISNKKSGRKERVTMLHAINESSEEGSDDDEDEIRELKGKAPMEIENSIDDEVLSVEKIADKGDGRKSVGASMRKRDDRKSVGASMQKRSLSLHSRKGGGI